MKHGRGSRPNRLPRPLVVIFAAGFSTAVAVAQESRRPKLQIHKESDRMVKFLELPSSQRSAVARLLALGAVAVPDLRRALSDPRPEIVTTVIQILRALGPEAAPALGRLHEMAAGDDARLAYAARWAISRIRPAGITLVADMGKQRVVEFDEKGVVLLEIAKLPSIWDAERLANGNYLISRGGANTVQELDRTGKVVWSYDKAKFPMDADRMPSGNTLICDTRNHAVIEVNRRGEIVWQYRQLKAPYDADRLPSGNTLVADYEKHRVLEIDPRGKVIWESPNLPNALAAERLPNGNTLVALWSQGEVREIDPKGRTVLQIKVPNGQPSSAKRLPNGNTLVACRGAAIEFDPKGKETWRVKIGSGGSATRY